MPKNTRTTIICLQLCMKVVHKVITPKQTVIRENHRRGPTKRTAIVDGSWKTTLDMVKMKIATEYRFPSSARSGIMLVTEAEEMMPESRRFKLHRIPEMVHSRRSTFRRSLRSSCRFSSLSNIILFAVATGDILSSPQKPSRGPSIDEAPAEAGSFNPIPN
ncbi:hypothetical protein ACJ73_07749 [Blastomyces percursus]|uniref:Uncharacterized protein n=1 Tax=Blastomyces percursus TaxID=1658174 RepID=A0A1J9PX36_9EURO|nr:hypothetical protein ACJ73_07749 [Blastomyces percursus]